MDLNIRFLFKNPKNITSPLNKFFATFWNKKNYSGYQRKVYSDSVRIAKSYSGSVVLKYQTDQKKGHSLQEYPLKTFYLRRRCAGCGGLTLAANEYHAGRAADYSQGHQHTGHRQDHVVVGREGGEGNGRRRLLS